MIKPIKPNIDVLISSESSAGSLLIV